jgi:para-nitrobenzyl esterase
MLLLACALSLLFFTGCGSAQKAQAPDAGKAAAAVSVLERQTAEGPVTGEENAATQTISWKAIPYAKAPVGDLRWRAPQAAEKRTQPLKADKFCSICPQYIDHDRNPATPQIVAGKEDCLYLNIWAPKNAAGNLPVFFWIHGGGNSIQWPLLSLQDGGILANRGNMIVITFNYRLGPMGFLNHPALKSGDEAGDSGNFTTLDTIAALKWVQANIKNFGGDPGNVTIAGESAGGENVYNLVVSPMAKGLFHRAISQSGSIRPSRPEAGTAHFNGILSKLMVKDGKAADVHGAQTALAAMSPREIEAYMRSKTAADFLEMYPEGKIRGMIFFPTSYSDGKVLPADFYGALASGSYNKVPMITGTNKEEMKLFLRGVPPFAGWLADGSLLKDPAKVQLWELAAKYQSDGWKVMAVDYPARLLRNQEAQPFIFTYQFLWGAGGAQNNVIAPPRNILLGACHAMEIDFVFGTEKASLGVFTFSEANKAGRVALSNAMMDYWSQFARTGNPNKEGSGLPKWSPWSNIAGFPKTLLLDADLEKAKITMGRSELTTEAIEEALKAEPRQKEIQPFWDSSPFRRR